MIEYDIQKWTTRIIQNWMIEYDIQKWMTRIIQIWMNVSKMNDCNHPKLDDYRFFLFYIEKNKLKSSKIG